MEAGNLFGPYEPPTRCARTLIKAAENENKIDGIQGNGDLMEAEDNQGDEDRM
jgi:hypothetical protein